MPNLKMSLPRSLTVLVRMLKYGIGSLHVLLGIAATAINRPLMNMPLQSTHVINRLHYQLKSVSVNRVN